MSNQLVSVVIVSLGNTEYIKLCLESVRAQAYSPLEIIVIDNSPDVHLSRLLSRDCPFIRIYASRNNLFYCQALNKGIEMSSGGFILCLNDDVILEKNFIEEASRGFAIHKRIGMVSGKILRPDKKTIDSAGLFLSLWRTACERGYNRQDRGQFERQGYIFGVNGAAAFYRKEMLGEIKEGGDYFDSGFQMFYEDLDVAWKAQNLGWQGYYMPRAIAYHVRGLTARKAKGLNRKFARLYLNDELNMHLIKNRYMAILKNESTAGFVLHLPAILLYDLVIWIYILVCRPRVIGLFFPNIKLLKSALKKRRAL